MRLPAHMVNKQVKGKYGGARTGAGRKSVYSATPNPYKPAGPDPKSTTKQVTLTVTGLLGPRTVLQMTCG